MKSRRERGRWRTRWVAVAALLAGCVNKPVIETPLPRPAESRALIDRLLPRGIVDRPGWVSDIYAGFTVLGLEPSRESVCAVVAVTEQESSFRVNPTVPGLPAIAWAEIDRRAAQVGVPISLVHSVLRLNSPTGRTYSERLDTAKTEKDLSDIFEDFIGAVPMGRTLFSERNPIRTRGPMQVSVAFAETYAASKPYPYPVSQSIADELFTRRGGMYFGMAHLLAYPAAYDRTLYRFADFNAGQYSSRDAAFQSALSTVSGIPIVEDGALIPRSEGKGIGATELAARSIAVKLGLNDKDIHAALEQARTPGFEHSGLYERVFALAERVDGHPIPHAMLPRIKLQGPKITRNLTTEWYAQRVNTRFERCLTR